MKNHNDFIRKLFDIESKEERYRFLNEYSMSLSPEELKDWTNGNFEQANDSLDKEITKEERQKTTRSMKKFGRL